ncbi:MAG: hypothetical protein LBO09_03330 [Candidatus Peribacteria bacterium]|jgi:hypothetical protein|nr:hypothetical protein [Candidatus Peribacteria bacterium]
MPGEERTYNDIKADKYEGMVKDLDLTFTTNLKLLKNANESYIRYYKSYIKLGASSGYKGENIINNEKYLADQEKYIENLLKESFIKLGKKTEYEQEIIKAGGVKVKVTGVPVEMKDYSAILLFLQEVM